MLGHCWPSRPTPNYTEDLQRKWRMHVYFQTHRRRPVVIASATVVEDPLLRAGSAHWRRAPTAPGCFGACSDLAMGFKIQKVQWHHVANAREPGYGRVVVRP